MLLGIQIRSLNSFPVSVPLPWFPSSDLNVKNEHKWNIAFKSIYQNDICYFTLKNRGQLGKHRLKPRRRRRRRRMMITYYYIYVLHVTDSQPRKDFNILKKKKTTMTTLS